MYKSESVICEVNAKKANSKVLIRIGAFIILFEFIVLLVYLICCSCFCVVDFVQN